MKYRKNREYAGTKARIDIITTDEVPGAEIPIFAYHYVFWINGTKWRTRPVSGFASAVAAREDGNRRMSEAIRIKRQIAEFS